MRRTYASFADPYGRDWVPRDPPPRDWEARSRPARDPSPFESASYPPAFLPQAYRSAFSPRRDERSYHEANACQNFRPDARDRGLPTGPPRPRHQVPSRPGPRPRARPRPPRHPRPPETSAARSRPLAPDAPRSDDPDFALKNRLIFAAIKAAHHLDNASGPDPLPIIARLTASLTASIRPAVPNAATLAFLDGNARDWGHTTTILLRDHYRATVAQKVSDLSCLADPAWRRNFDVAASWAARQYGHRLRQDTLDALRSELRRELDAPDPADALRDGSLPSSDLPPPSPDPGAPDSDDRKDRSPSQNSCYSLFSSLFLPTSSPLLPLLPPLPAVLRPPPAAPLPQRTTPTSVLPWLRTLATPPPPAPASPGTTPPHVFAQTSASALPRRRTLATPLQPAPASPGMTPPSGSAQTNARRDAVPVGSPVGSDRARQTFNPPADSAILDTPIPPEGPV